MINRSQLKNDAKEALKGKWGISLSVLLIYILLYMGISVIPVIGYIASILFSPIFSLGITIFFLKISRHEKVEIGTLFSGFPFFWKIIGLNFLVGLFSFLWSLLFIIPGIVASLSYSMVFYILIDNPKIKILDAIKESKRITKGYKKSIFMLNLSFIGWALLSCLTFGIGFIWLSAYMQTTISNLYTKIKDR